MAPLKALLGATLETPSKAASSRIVVPSRRQRAWFGLGQNCATAEGRVGARRAKYLLSAARSHRQRPRCPTGVRVGVFAPGTPVFKPLPGRH